MERSPFDDSTPEETPAPPAEEKGELVSPTRKPPAIVGSGEQPPRPPRRSRGAGGEVIERQPSFRQIVERALDVLDAAGDAIATRLRLR